MRAFRPFRRVPSIILVAALTFCGSAAASGQDTAVSSTPPKPSSTEDGNSSAPAASLDRIRERLTQPAPLAQSLEKRPTFHVEVEREKSLQELLAELDFDLKSNPAPAGGLYMYEQQRRMFDPIHNPLMQPYAAFSGGEFLTLAIEGLIQKYLGGKLLSSLTSSERERETAAARAEVAAAISNYCAALPAGGAGIGLCSEARRGSGVSTP